MRTTTALSVTVPVEMAKMIKEKVASGQYASESEVVREGLRALAERDEAVERWLREEVAATYDRHKAAPHEAIPLDEAWKRLQSYMDRAEKKAS
jgi:antitoxin ParD1/3/4